MLIWDSNQIININCLFTIDVSHTHPPFKEISFVDMTFTMICSSFHDKLILGEESRGNEIIYPTSEIE